MRHDRFHTRHHTIAAPLLAVLCLLVIASSAAAQTAGSIMGRATHMQTGQALEGAQVRLLESSRQTVTGADGRFMIPGVLPGTYQLQVSYVGLEPQTRTVAVAASAVSVADVAMPVAAIALAGLEVLGVRAMSQAAALSRQKNAPNIINVIAADQMGRFPDASAPEALQRVPGVALARDQGEGRYIQIRGGSADFTQVSLNGASVPSPEGAERRVALDAVPVDILESIEVTKAITPDMEASGIGGAVNLVTRKAPEYSLFSAELGGGFAPIRGEPSGEGSITFGRRLADQRFGVLLSGSYSTRRFGSDDIEPEYDLGGPGTSDDVLSEFASRYYSLERNRVGATASLDYRLSDASRFSLTGTYTAHEDTEERQVLLHAIEDGELSWEHKNRQEELQIGNITFGGEHTLTSGVGIRYGAGWSRSAEDTPFDKEIVFLQEGVTFSPDMTNPQRSRPNPSAASVNGTYVFDGLDDGSSITTNVDRSAHIDFTLPYRAGSSTGAVKFGARLLDRDKDRDLTEFEWSQENGSDIVLGRDVGSAFSAAGYNPGNYLFPPFSTTGRDVLDFTSRFSGQLESEFNVEAESEDYDLSERVTGLYAMTELNVTPSLMVLPGVRYEHTDFAADGFEFDPDTETVSPTSGSKDYGNFFPMLHVLYRLGEQTNVRAAFTSTIARPNFFDLVPYRIRDDEDLEIGNPDLEPSLGRSFDLLLEHYDRRIGVLSAGAFYKRLANPIFTFRSSNQLGGETVLPDNGQTADILGLEVAVHQQLSFLPAPFDGLGVYGNYTRTQSEGTLPDGRTAPLIGQADNVWNAALSYERFGFSGQLGLNYHSDYADEYGDDEAEDIFVGSRHQLDLSASYRVQSSSMIYVEFMNLTNRPFRLYQGVDTRPRQIEYYEPWATIGIRYSMNRN